MNKGRRFKVFIDGKEVGLIKNDSVEEYEVSPGVHTIVCKIDWMKSEAVQIEVPEASVYYRVRTSMKYFFVLYIMLLAGVLLPFIFGLMKVPMPSIINSLRWLLIAPAVLYLVYYYTLGRNNYLVVEKDVANPFA